MALLFFLMCSVVGTILLISATAASGRMKDMKTEDQDRYAVFSAAELLKKDIQDQPEIVYGVETDMDKHFYNYGVLGNPNDINNDWHRSASELTILEKLITDVNIELDAGNLSGTASDSFKMKVDGYPDLTIDVKMTLTANGSLEAEVSNNPPAGQVKTIVYLNADKDVKEDQRIGDYQYKIRRFYHWTNVTLSKKK